MFVYYTYAYMYSDRLSASGLPADAISFNTALGACERGGQWEQALDVLRRMASDGLRPGPIAFGVVASACERGGALGAGVRLAVQLATGRSLERARESESVKVDAQAGGDFRHASVLLDEVVEAFAAADLQDGGVIVDCTLGGAGHSAALMERLPGCRLLGIDQDTVALKAAGERLARFGDRVRLAHGNFGDIAAHVAAAGMGGGPSVVGILADLGVSSPQLDVASRGFSFRADGPLDMRMDASNPKVRPASWYVANLALEELAREISVLGDEEHADEIARRLKEAQPETTLAAARLIEDCVPREAGGRSVHPATRTFQALRILVNGELTVLERLLAEAPRLLAPGGLLSLITFHSLEDDLVRRCMRGDLSRDLPQAGRRGAAAPPFVPAGGREGVRPTAEEIAANPRSSPTE